MDDLEKTIADLMYRYKRADDDSAELALIERALEGLLVYEHAQAMIEGHGLLLNRRPVHQGSQPGKVLPLQRPPRRTKGSRPQRSRSSGTHTSGARYQPS